MKIGIIADSPTLTTGFGIEAYHVASAPVNAGYQVVCFGLKGTKTIDQHSELPFRIWPVDVTDRWDIILKDFLWQENPDLTIILIDLFNLREIIDYCNAAHWNGPIWLYLTPDGIPAYDEYLAPLKRVQKCIVTTQTCANYLEQCGVEIAAVIPGGVDTQIFNVLDNRDLLREKAGLDNKFVVGVFGRNCERKQQHRILDALKEIQADSESENVVVYFHCVVKGHWRLDEIASELGIRNKVLFPDELQDETRGVQPRSNISPANLKTSLYLSDERPMLIPESYGYVERINCCDMIINAANCGDFEHIILESQACGIPLAHTDDCGIMTEAMGTAGLKLKASDVSRGQIGQRIFFANPKSIANAILSVKKKPAFAQKLRQRGVKRAKGYSWSKFQNAMVKLIIDWASAQEK